MRLGNANSELTTLDQRLRESKERGASADLAVEEHKRELAAMSVELKQVRSSSQEQQRSLESKESTVTDLQAQLTACKELLSRSESRVQQRESELATSAEASRIQGLLSAGSADDMKAQLRSAIEDMQAATVLANTAQGRVVELQQRLSESQAATEAVSALLNEEKAQFTRLERELHAEADSLRQEVHRLQAEKTACSEQLSVAVENAHVAHTSASEAKLALASSETEGRAARSKLEHELMTVRQQMQEQLQVFSEHAAKQEVAMTAENRILRSTLEQCQSRVNQLEQELGDARLQAKSVAGDHSSMANNDASSSTRTPRGTAPSTPTPPGGPPAATGAPAGAAPVLEGTLAASSLTADQFRRLDMLERSHVQLSEQVLNLQKQKLDDDQAIAGRSSGLFVVPAAGIDVAFLTSSSFNSRA